ncbi:MAG: rhamnulokinase family protein [Actinomycetia bacterium]|nr:rhamnulokinase family protein [Actinomycetes bacterium]
MTKAGFAAADLGATSGRVILGVLSDGRFELRETRRFPTPTLTAEDGSLHWDLDRLLSEVTAGFEAALARYPELGSVGIDTWGVDYGRVGAGGSLLEPPYHYRDSRTDQVPEQFFEKVSARELYGRAGLQVMPFNTIFQLAAGAGAGWDRTESVILLPDLFGYLLTGRRVAEVTIASTTGLLDTRRRQWCPETLAEMERHYGLPLRRVLPELVEPGTVLADAASWGVPVVSVGGHDTASAVVTVPTQTEHFAYISSGTWSLVGLELDQPVLSEDSQRANFTNELGVDHSVRFLKNVMGLWVLTESMRTWERAGQPQELQALLAAAAEEPALGCVLDMSDERLIAPGDMPARLAQMARATGQRPPEGPVAVTRCILDSLALAYRRSIREACQLSSRHVDVVHVVGGGCRNELLCQLTAEATGLPVVAGPAEGTALGNLLVQARAVGALGGGLMELREVARASSQLARYQPGVLGLGQERWRAAEERLG